MELCKRVEAEEYVIHVIGSTNLYTHLQFSLLASSWFPRCLGVCLWSVLHVFLVLYEAFMLLFLIPIVFLLAILMDVFIVCLLIYTVLLLPLAVIIYFLGQCIAIVLAWLWLVISCQCWTLPGRAPGQGLGQYIYTAGGTRPRPNVPQPVPAVGGGGATGNRPCNFFTLQFVNHVTLVSFPYWREKLRDLCGEIVPSYDITVI